MKIRLFDNPGTGESSVFNLRLRIAEIYYYIMDKHGVIYGRSTSKTRLQEKMKNNFTEAVIRKLGIEIVEVYDSI